MTTMQKSPAKTAPALLFLLCMASSCAASSPESDAPADYSHALPLQISGKQGVLALRLPQPVYLHARTAGLDDLRVFDAHGTAQPHALHRPPEQALAQRTWLAARIFPVRSKTHTVAGGSPAIDIDIRTRPDGSVLSVQAHAGQANGHGSAVLDSLILDFGSIDQGKGSETAPAYIEALRFGAPKERTNYNAQIWLETSNDLKQWSAIGAAELGWLSNDHAQRLTHDRLELSPQTFRYARLTWRRGEPVLFADIQAEVVTRQRSEPFRETLWVKPEPGQQAGDLLYKASIAMPVEQISVRLNEANIVYPMAFGAYVERPSRQVGKATEWVFQPSARATFYQITQDGETRRSGPLTIRPGHQQEWVIRPLNTAATAQPQLGLTWQPATLIFLAGGTPPYRLYFGRPNARPTSQPLSQVAPGFTVHELDRLESAQVGELQSGHAGPVAASAAALASRSARNRTYVLWGVLLLGVLVLGGMTWRLVGQMNRSASKAGEQ